MALVGSNLKFFWGIQKVGLQTLAYVSWLSILKVVIVDVQNVLVLDVHKVFKHLRNRTNRLFGRQLQGVGTPGDLAAGVIIEAEVDCPVRTFSDQMISFGVLHCFYLHVCALIVY